MSNFERFFVPIKMFKCVYLRMIIIYQYNSIFYGNLPDYKSTIQDVILHTIQPKIYF